MIYIFQKPRFIIALIISTLTFIALNTLNSCSGLQLLEKNLIAFNAFQWSYLISLIILCFNADSEKIDLLAKNEDETGLFLFGITFLSAFITFAGIISELSTAKSTTDETLKLIHMVLPAVTLIGVWLLLPVLFAIHYAHIFYLADDHAPPFLFPDRIKCPDYFDFLYFSFTIAVAAQTADISVNNSKARRIVLYQSILSFIFNTSVLALGINVASGLLN